MAVLEIMMWAVLAVLAAAEVIEIQVVLVLQGRGLLVVPVKMVPIIGAVVVAGPQQPVKVVLVLRHLIMVGMVLQGQ
jgi:hypothetical protein